VSIRVTTFVNGRWKENCYIAATPEGDAVVIDPGSQADDLISLVQQQGWRIHAVINTHGHFDHIGAVAAIKERYQAPFFLHGLDERLLQRANLFRMVFEARDPISVPTVTHNIAELPQQFEIGPLRISWIATPGHTEGSVCLQMENFLFSGDTLMRGAVGRTDLPGGNRDQLLNSVRGLMSLPAGTIVCGGHGPQTTIATEFAPGSPVRSLLQ
jgi:glyoxylase-like metal-dependent hydrolase (beta-lactamase superfamily II)